MRACVHDSYVSFATTAPAAHAEVPRGELVDGLVARHYVLFWGRAIFLLAVLLQQIFFGDVCECLNGGKLLGFVVHDFHAALFHSSTTALGRRKLSSTAASSTVAGAAWGAATFCFSTGGSFSELGKTAITSGGTPSSGRRFCALLRIPGRSMRPKAGWPRAQAFSISCTTTRRRTRA